ncbi:MAG: hypothetical protein J6K45_04975 [Clostridia bacterium]|nr:hypothetical protein [Clostridia bacterium]
MDFEDFEITRREILVVIAITFMLIGIGVLISGAIKNGIDEKNEHYYKALKIRNDEEMFKYAIKTNVGYTFAEGKVQAIDGVSIDDIEGKYFYIKKVKEEYTRHERQVEHEEKIGNETYTYYTTEEYWTWDYAGQEEFNTKKFKFLDEEFEYGAITFSNEEYKDTKPINSNLRYKYYIIPSEFEGTLFTYINNNTINQSNFFINNTIDRIIESKEKESDIYCGVFWGIWIIFIFFIDFGYVYLENNYLEG